MKLTEPELTRWGRQVGGALRGPAFLALTGPLGAGKSTFARAVGRGAGIDDAMPSPTYNLLLAYNRPDGGVLVHVDLYRLENPADLRELGWSDLGSEDEVVVVEWPERAGDFLPPDRWEIVLSIPEDDWKRREVEVRRVGDPPPLPAFPLGLVSEDGGEDGGGA